MLRIALINGCQHKAGRYAQAAARLRNLKFFAVAQPDPVKRKAAAEALGGAIAAETLSQLLSDHAADFDAVAIHGSVAKRAELACQAAQAGKHVFVSSPLAATAAEVDRIAAACRAAGVTLTVGSHVRSRPSVAAVKSAIDSGKLGVPGLLRIHSWEPNADGEQDQNDKTRHRDHGEFRSRVIQQLDLALWMFPKPPMEVYAVGRDAVGDKNAWPEYVQIHLGFPEGGMALISVCRSLPPGDDYQTVSLIASTGAAYADDHLQKQLLFRGERPVATQHAEMIPAIVTQLREFQQVIADKRHPADAAAAMKSALALTEAAWTSLAEHRPVRLTGENS